MPYGPFGTTVRSFRLMLADGTVVTCSRGENAELFGLAVGGYGLFGIVIDAELELADNALLAARHEVMPADAFAPRFTAVAREAGVRMAYGRLSVARDIISPRPRSCRYRPAASQPSPLPPPRTSDAFHYLSRRVFRAQTGSEAAKKRRWYLETVIAPRVTVKKPVTRNAILNNPVASLADTDRRRTDILHEYFVAPERFAEFLVACREIIPASGQELLNVTLRHLEADSSVLSFAPAPRIAAVMLFPQQMSDEAERSMRAMTERLIDRVLALGGSYLSAVSATRARRPVARRLSAHRGVFGEEAQLRSAAAISQHDVGDVFRLVRIGWLSLICPRFQAPRTSSRNDMNDLR